MCFSATASFTGAAAAGVAGAMAVSRTGAVRELPLAGIPIIFGVQQAIEGLLWLTFQHGWPGNYLQVLANAFVFIALAVWPWLVPFAVGLVEEDRTRRRVIALLVPAGAAVAGYSVLTMLQHPYAAKIVHSSICYVAANPHPYPMLVLYAVCTCAPLFLATERFLRLLGVVVITGAVVSALFFYESFVSVWCFFAAAASVVIYLEFERRHAHRAEAISRAARS